MADDSTLMSAFMSFCGMGNAEMDGKTFAKLCKDSGLVDRRFTPTDVDLIFAKVVTKGQRRITFSQFEAALSHCAHKKGVTAEEISAKVASTQGPILHATVADTVRFHDDKTTYTGTHQHGGPEHVIKGEGHLPGGTVFSYDRASLPSTLRAPDVLSNPRVPSPGRTSSKEAQRYSTASTGSSSYARHSATGDAIMGRTPSKGTATTPSRSPSKGEAGRSSSKGDPMGRTPSKDSGGAMGRTPSRGNAYQRSSSKGESTMGRIPSNRAGAAAGTWQGTFQAYCGTSLDMDGKSFAKLLKDCSLLDKNFSSTDADLIFARVVTKGLRRITQEQFREAMRLVAERRKMPLDEIVDRVTAIQGPMLYATVPDAVRFHDDKSTYTGTHINGGPSSVATGTGTATQLASAGMRTAN